MKNLKDHRKYNFITFVYFLLFFLAICFVTTANIYLFAHNMNLDEAAVRESAPRVFINIFVLSFLLTLITILVAYFSTSKEIQKILHFTDKVSKGNYKERLEVKSSNIDPHGYKAIKRNLNKMVEELGSVETLRTDFISNVSHELKTPLSVIQNLATLIQDSSLDEKIRSDYSMQIVNQTTKLSSLITNILRLNKLENQKIFANKKKVNISELVCECMINFEQKWEEKNLIIQTEIEDDVIIFTDSELLTIVINNLISNAIKFTEDNGSVSIKVSRIGNQNALISISDTGCGMDSKTGNHIFDKFYQGDTSHNSQGNGLGLALVKRIVDILGYDINVESEVGIGSTFTIICRADEIMKKN